MRPVTDRQKAALRRLALNGGWEMFSPDLCRQLEKRGLVEITGHKRSRTEYNRPVKGSTLWQVRLTTAGKNLLPVLGLEFKEKK